MYRRLFTTSCQIAKSPTILAIETSCDDTCVAILRGNHLKSNVVLSQNELNFQNGGIIPRIASTEHRRRLPYAIKEAFQISGLKCNDIDIIAATRGPGIAACLSVGYHFGRGLSAIMEKPFIPINHLEGHVLAVRMRQPVNFPFLSLLLTGGHTQLILAQSLGKYSILGSTRDESLGEVIDKGAKKIGLRDSKLAPGSLMSKAAERCDIDPKWPTIEVKSAELLKNSLDFSFTGIRTAFENVLNTMGSSKENPSYQEFGAKFLLDACSEHIMDRLVATVKRLQISTLPLVITGGVARNYYLVNRIRSKCQEKLGQVFICDQDLCSDNAAMIGWAAFESIRHSNKVHKDYEDVSQFWPIDELKLDHFEAFV